MQIRNYVIRRKNSCPRNVPLVFLELFLNLSAPPKTDGTKEGEEGDQTPLLQPNKQGFKELVSRGGGQSANTAGTRRDLDYVLKLTSTTVPEHLQCAICEKVVQSAMLFPWDTEGRTVCETCIR